MMPENIQHLQRETHLFVRSISQVKGRVDMLECQVDVRKRMQKFR